MARIGTIEARIRARTDGLRRDGQQARGIFRGISGNATRMQESIGSSMMKLGVVVGSVLAGIKTAGFFVNMASQAEETEAKFDTVFASISRKADIMAKNLAKSYKMSKQESQKLLGDTADLLIGFGMQTEQALELSNGVQKLSADLASFNNLQGGTTRASEILTKALLGERMGLIALGIKISDADVKQRLLEKGQGKLSGQALLTAKSIATYELALQQTAVAQGDMARTGGSYANQMKELKGHMKDLTVEIGKSLLPALTAWITDLNLIMSEIDRMRTDRAIKKLKSLKAERDALMENQAMKGASNVFFKDSNAKNLKKINEELKKTLELLNDLEGNSIELDQQYFDLTGKHFKKDSPKGEESKLKSVEELKNIYDKIQREGVLPKTIDQIGREIGQQFMKSLKGFSIPIMSQFDTKDMTVTVMNEPGALLNLNGRGQGSLLNSNDTTSTSSDRGGWTDDLEAQSRAENIKYAEGREAAKRRKVNEKEPEKVQSNLSKVTEGLASAIPVIGAFTGGLASGIIAILTSSTTWKDSMEKMSKPIMEIVEVIGYALKPVLDLVVDSMRGLAKVVTWVYNEVFVGLANGIISIVNGIIKMVNWAIPGKKWDIAQVEYLKRTYDLTDATEKQTKAINDVTSSLFNLSKAVNMDILRARTLGGLSNNNMTSNVNINLTTDQGTFTVPLAINPKTGTVTKADVGFQEFMYNQRMKNKGFVGG